MIISPTMAAIIVLRADSTFALSPPESIHLIPPQIRKINAKTIAMIIIHVKRKGSELCGVRRQREPNPCPASFGHGLITAWP